jgi:hypothetical protein
VRAKPLSRRAKPLSDRRSSVAGEAALRAKPLSAPLVPLHDNQRGANCKKDPDSTTHLAAFWLFSGCYTRGVVRLSAIPFPEVQLFDVFSGSLSSRSRQKTRRISKNNFSASSDWAAIKAAIHAVRFSLVPRKQWGI